VNLVAEAADPVPGLALLVLVGPDDATSRRTARVGDHLEHEVLIEPSTHWAGDGKDSFGAFQRTVLLPRQIVSKADD